LRFLYWVYALRLRRQISSHAVPRHIGIILDGNRRYARKHHLAHSRVAYDLGAEKLDDVLAWCLDLGIPAVTLWVGVQAGRRRMATALLGREVRQ